MLVKWMHSFSGLYYGSVLGPHWHFFIFHSLICKIHTLICKFYTLICKFYTLICKIYILICKIYTLICKIHTLICKIYSLFDNLRLNEKHGHCYYNRT